MIIKIGEQEIELSAINEALKDSGHIVVNTSEPMQSEWVKNFEQETFNKASNKAYSNVENVLSERGFSKKEGEKSSEYFSRFAEENAKGYESLKAEYDKLKNENTDDVWKAKLSEIEENAKLKIQEFQDKYNQLEGQYSKKEREAYIDSQLSNINKLIKPSLLRNEESKFLVDNTISRLKDELMSDNTITFVDNFVHINGEIQKDNMFQPVTAENFLKSKLNPILGNDKPKGTKATDNFNSNVKSMFTAKTSKGDVSINFAELGNLTNVITELSKQGISTATPLGLDIGRQAKEYFEATGKS
jgi:Skp family chaperone for outer membrane proteins